MVNKDLKIGLIAMQKPLGLLRTGFTMIELIFAIVIISISMLTLPAMMTQDAVNQESSLMQEGILLATTKAAQVLTFAWDQQSSPGGVLMSTSQVLGTVASPDGLGRAGVSDFRVGHFQEQLRRRLTPNSDPRSATVVGVVNVPVPNINDFHNETFPIVSTPGSEEYAYKKSWNITTDVSYVSDDTNYTQENIGFNFSDVGGAVPTNIKKVRVTATDTTATTLAVNGNQVVLTSYSANIGETEFYKRRYQ